MADRSDVVLTKIIATLGPASADPQVICRLIEEGARVFRINFSHGGFEGFEKLLSAARYAAQETGVHAGVLGDLSGPKIRVGQVIGPGVMLDAGDHIRFQGPAVTAGQRREGGDGLVFSTTCPDILKDIEPGHRLLIDDGSVRTLVVEKQAGAGGVELVCSVTAGGLVTSAKGINLPDTRLSVPSLTEHDLRCVEWAVRHELDFLALSFVREAEDLRVLRSHLSRLDAGRPMPIIAKIERPEALEHLEGIVEAADALMVARGDLGVEMDLAKVPVIQKRLIATTHDHGKPVIVATQMLQSMIEAPSPTRAEVSDVANAIYDGADAVMLSGETAVGRFATRAVGMMGLIAQTTQADIGAGRAGAGAVPRRYQDSRYRTAALADGVNTIVRDLDAKAMAVWSQRGGGARYLSQTRPPIPIIAASSDRSVLRRMMLGFAVVPVLMEQPASIEDFVNKIDRLICERGWGRAGDQVVVVAGEPIGTPGVTNTLIIRQLGGICRVP